MDGSRGWACDLHTAFGAYVVTWALTGIGSRSQDLLWSMVPTLRSAVDVVFGYGLAIALVGSQLMLWLRMRGAALIACVVYGAIAAMCLGTLVLQATFGAVAYAVYEGRPYITLAVALLLLAGTAPRRKQWTLPSSRAWRVSRR